MQITLIFTLFLSNLPWFKLNSQSLLSLFYVHSLFHTQHLFHNFNVIMCGRNPMTRKCQGPKYLYSLKNRLEMRYFHMSVYIILKYLIFFKVITYHFRCSNKHTGLTLTSIILSPHIISSWLKKIHHSLTTFFKAWFF